MDIYAKVTDSIVAMLEAGVRPWIRPWKADHGGRSAMPLRSNGIPYSGINVLLLWGETMRCGYASSMWMTYKQAEELGAHVRRGEKGTMIVYASTRSKKVERDGEEIEESYRFLRAYWVFNVEQIDELPERFRAARNEVSRDLPARIDDAEQFLRDTGADVRHGGSRAYYAVAADYIQLPRYEAFADRESYYATAFHELTHWTKSRLDRDFRAQRFGDTGYAREELVAELGAAFLSAELAITDTVREDHASYLATWLKVLRGDKHAIFNAASHAQKAASYLLGLRKAPALQEAA